MSQNNNLVLEKSKIELLDPVPGISYFFKGS